MSDNDPILRSFEEDCIVTGGPPPERQALIAKTDSEAGYRLWSEITDDNGDVRNYGGSSLRRRMSEHFSEYRRAIEAKLFSDPDTLTEPDHQMAVLAVYLLDKDHTRETLRRDLTVLFANHREREIDREMDRLEAVLKERLK